MPASEKAARMNGLAMYVSWVACTLVVALMGGVVQAASVPVTQDRAVAARVSGAAIYLDELIAAVDGAKNRYRKAGFQSISPEFEKKIERQELEQLIDVELLVQAGAHVTDKEFAYQVEHRIAALGKARFNNATSAQQQPPAMDATLREKLRRDALVDAYLEKRGISSLKVPEKDVAEFYEKNKKSFTEPEKVKASHILIGVPRNAKPEDVDGALAKARRISEELKAGGDFATLAKEYSSCATAVQGGDLGYLQVGFMPKDFNAVAFALKPGETSEPVRTQHGFHIIKVFDKQPARVPELSEVKETISKYLINDYKRKMIDEIVAELKQKARIETHLND